MAYTSNYSIQKIVTYVRIIKEVFKSLKYIHTERKRYSMLAFDTAILFQNAWKLKRWKLNLRKFNRSHIGNEEDSAPSTYPIWLSLVDDQRRNR